MGVSNPGGPKYSISTNKRNLTTSIEFPIHLYRSIFRDIIANNITCGTSCIFHPRQRTNPRGARIDFVMAMFCLDCDIREHAKRRAYQMNICRPRPSCSCAFISLECMSHTVTNVIIDEVNVRVMWI